MKHEFITGATGLLGSYLLREALLVEQPVAVLVRGQRRQTAAQRVSGLVAEMEAALGRKLPAPVVLEGDLREPGLGLSPSSLEWVGQNCQRVVHCAASLQFQVESASSEPYRSNVDGTRHLLRMCQNLGIGHFHLISSAYVCGDRQGLVSEQDLECGQQFNNDYERSKFMAEVLVRQAPWLDHWTLYRPSVIVGDTDSGYTSSFDGAYAFLRLARLFAGKSLEESLQSLGLDACDRVNLVPVNWVSACIRSLIDRDDRPSGQTYHLTSSHPLTPEDLYQATLGRADSAPAVPTSALDEVLRVYRPYLRNHPIFQDEQRRRDCPERPCPCLDRTTLESMVAFALQSGGGVGVRLHVGEQEVWSSSQTVTSTVEAFCSEPTWEALLAGDLKVEAALYEGWLLLEGEPDDLEPSLAVLRAYVEERRTC
jgi:thioester reductase-like protein